MSVKPVDVEPEVVLVSWSIMQDASGFRLVGLHGGTQMPRVSSAIQGVDAHQMTAVTRSGRWYLLRGPADNDAAAAIILAHMRRFGLGVKDVALADWSELLILTGFALTTAGGTQH